MLVVTFLPLVYHFAWISLYHFPGLAQNEKKRRQLFYSRRGMDDPEVSDADSNLNLCLAQLLEPEV